MNRIEESQPRAGFSWFICNGFGENNEDFWWKAWNIGEEVVYLR